jgi:WD40 repeat protein
MDGKKALRAIEQFLEREKQPKLKDVQQIVLLGVWERKSYDKIAQELDYDPGYIRQVASGLWKHFSELTGEKISKSNLRSIVQSRCDAKIVDWGEAIDVQQFYGREQDFTTLSRWILADNCRLVGIFGLGGMGKTTLSVRISQEVRCQFDVVLWRSLRQAPTPPALLGEILTVLTGGDLGPENALALLMQELRERRCLLILDNIESILEPGDQSGKFLPGYEAYGQMLERIADESHQSCLILTGREKPNGLTRREGSNLPVRSLQLAGLSSEAAQLILQDKGLAAAPDRQQALVQYFSGNPLAVKIAATVIQNLFSGDIQAFLEQGAVFGDLWKLLNQQFERLSTLQKQIMYWLAIHRESITPADLKAKFLGPVNTAKLLETLETLHERSLIETDRRGLTQQPVIMEYMTEQLIQQIVREIIEGELIFFKSHALIEAQTRDFLRETQIQLILKPLVEMLLNHFGGRAQIVVHLRQLLSTFRHQDAINTGYGVGNIINLLGYLQSDLTSCDFSHLHIRQAFLRNAILHNVDFRGSHLSQTVFTETFGDILGIAFSPDGQNLATSDNKGVVQIWDVGTVEQKICCSGHQHWAWDISFSPDSQYLASVGDDYLLRLWDANNGELLSLYRGHSRPVNTVVFSPDGRMLATASQDHTIRLWQVHPTGNPEIFTLAGHHSRVWSIGFSPDGLTLVSGGEDNMVRLWDVATGECFVSWQAHDNWVRAVTFSPDGRSIATCSYDRTIKIWPCPQLGQTEAPQPLHVLRGHQQTVSDLAFSPDGQHLASSSFDRSIKLWEVATGKCLKTLLGHRDRVWSVAFHPGGKLIGSGGDDHSTKIWDLDLGRCINTIVGHANGVVSLDVSADRRYLVGGYEDTTIRIWDIYTGKIVYQLREHSNRIWSTQFSPNGHILASSSSDYKIKLWDWRAEKCLKTIEGHKSWVWMVAFSPDGRWLASSSYDRTVKLWDVDSGECLLVLSERSSPAVAVAFSPNGYLLASSGFDGTVEFWDCRSGECLRTLQAHGNSVWSVNFSSDGQWLISSSYDQTLKLWNVSTGECVRTFVGHQAPILKACFSPDDLSIVSGGLDSVLKVWDVATGACLQTLQGHQGLVYALDVVNVRLSEHGPEQLVAFSGGSDETIKVWDLETAACVQSWKPLRPYEGMKINNIQGLAAAQLATLRVLGAID